MSVRATRPEREGAREGGREGGREREREGGREGERGGRERGEGGREKGREGERERGSEGGRGRREGLVINVRRIFLHTQKYICGRLLKEIYMYLWWALKGM